MSVGAAFCPHCRSNIEPGAVFCGKCGGNVEAQPPTAQVTAAPAAAFCPHCGAGVGLGSSFCPNCGSRIGLTPGLAPAQTYPGYGSPSYGRGFANSQAEGSSPYSASPTILTEVAGTSSTLQSVSTDNFCNKCGGKLRHESLFCPSCGNPVAKPQPTATTAPPGILEQPRSETKPPSMPAPIPRLCKTCGNALAANGSFCTRCGTPTFAPSGVPSIPSTASQQAYHRTTYIPAANATNWQGSMLNEPEEVLAMATKAAISAGLIPKVSRYDYFRADATKSPGKVMLGGLAYYLAAKTDRIEVWINKLATPGSHVTVYARGATGQQALKILATSFTTPNLAVVS